MIEFKTNATFGKFKYTNIPPEFIAALLPDVILTAYKSAVKHAPYDPTPDGIHIKEELKHEWIEAMRRGAVWVRLPYANSAEYGTKSRLAHPFIRPASKAGRQYMRRNLKKVVNEVIKEERAKHGDS
jgi:hypothetical protein